MITPPPLPPQRLLHQLATISSMQIGPVDRKNSPNVIRLRMLKKLNLQMDNRTKIFERLKKIDLQELIEMLTMRIKLTESNHYMIYLKNLEKIKVTLELLEVAEKEKNTLNLQIKYTSHLLSGMQKKQDIKLTSQFLLLLEKRKEALIQTVAAMEEELLTLFFSMKIDDFLQMYQTKSQYLQDVKSNKKYTKSEI
jgi:hypothetical protein